MTLINGEKVLPLPIEGRIRKADLVKEAVVFGIGRSIPGLLLFRAEAAKDLTDEAFVKAVWPKVQRSNELAETFSHISKDMVVTLPYGLEIPTTDKGSIIRARVYQTYAGEIDTAYRQLEGQDEGKMKLTLSEMENYILGLAQQVMGPRISDPHNDLFTQGLTSLQAIQIRGNIVRDLDLGGSGRKLSQNIIFEQGNLVNLAKYLDDLRLNVNTVSEKPVEAMKRLVSKYTVSVGPRQANYPPASRNVVVSVLYFLIEEV